MRKYQRGFIQFLPAIASVGAALIGAKGQDDANEESAHQAQLNRDFNAAEAEKNRTFNSAEAVANREFQREMSSTAYQRAVGDMQKAGLNPMLAYSQGGAPQPSGSQASGSAASSSAMPQVGNKAAAAMTAMASAAQVQNLVKSGENIDADTELKKAQAVRELNSASNLTYQTERIITAEIPLIRQQIQTVTSQGMNYESHSALMQAQKMVAQVEAELKVGQIGQVEAQTALTKIETLLKKLQEPEARAYAEKFKGEFGGQVSPYLRDILGILGALLKARPN